MGVDFWGWGHKRKTAGENPGSASSTRPKRRREGTHYVRIPLESFDIEGLIRLKVLPKAHREDADALQAAVLTTLVYQALDGAG